MLFNLSRPPTALRRSTSEFLQLCRQLPSARRALYVTSRSKTMSEPKVLSVEDLSSSEAKYVSVRRIHMLSEVSNPDRHGSPCFPISGGSNSRSARTVTRRAKRRVYRLGVAGDPHELIAYCSVSGSLRNAPRVHPPALMACASFLRSKSVPSILPARPSCRHSRLASLRVEQIPAVNHHHRTIQAAG